MYEFKIEFTNQNSAIIYAHHINEETETRTIEFRDYYHHLIATIAIGEVKLIQKDGKNYYPDVFHSEDNI